MVELVLLNIYIYTSILLLIFNLYIIYVEILFDLYWVFPESELDTNIWMQITHLGDDHEESARNRGTTETGAREKSDKYECISGQLGLNSIGWISEKLTSELSCQAMGASDIGVQTLHWAEAHSVHIPVPLTSLSEITIWGALRRLKGNWDKASEGLLVLG